MPKGSSSSSTEGMVMRAAALATFMVLGACLPCVVSAGPDAPGAASVVLPIVVHVAEVDGQPVVPADFIAERVERANAIFAPYAVSFAVSATRPLAAAHAVLESRADRDALASEVGKGVIDCFVVRSMRDVDVPTEMRRGVHWHAPSAPGSSRRPHFVILTALGGVSVLAHELGHYLGNPAHSAVVGNLMSYDHGGQLPVLDAAQLKRLERTLRGYLRRRELVPVASPQG
jgi:hypothetical protein